MAATTVRVTDGISPIFSSGSRRAYNLLLCKSNQRFASVAYGRLTDPKFGTSTERPRKERKVNPYSFTEAAQPEERKSLTDFFVEAEDFFRSDGGDGGPPRWFSPLECGARAPGSPLLLYVPDLVKLIERTVRSEKYRLPKRPIYIVGDSIGACLALDVAASNPDIDLVLILANPVTRFNNFMLQPLSGLLDFLPDRVPSLIQENFGLNQGYPFAAMFESMLNESDDAQMAGGLLRDFFTASANLPTLIRIFPMETLLWKLQLLKSASASANSHMFTAKAQTLLLLSGRDQWLLNQEDIEKLRGALPKCEIRKFVNNGHFLFLEDGVDLVTIMKTAYFYSRGNSFDCISDYILPTPFEFKEYEESQRLLTAATSPVFLSTLDKGIVVRSLAGIPSEGPVLYVGNHMLLGAELLPVAIHFLKDKNIMLRGIAHPVLFTKKIGSKLPDIDMFDPIRLIGAVPVSDINFYKLLRSKAHVVLYPGGVREALHRKGEVYKLFWPQHSEFVRIASKFGAKIIPFGAVGEDDLCKIVLDYDDQMKIPFLKNFIEELTQDTAKLRSGEEGELGNQDLHMP